MQSAIFFSPKYKQLGIYLPKLRKRIKFCEHYFSTLDKEIIHELRDKIVMQDGCDYIELSGRNINNKRKLKIMLQRMGGLGDILFTTPIAKYLKGLGHEVNYHIHFGYHEALENNPYIDTVYVNADVSKYKLPKGIPNLLNIEDMVEYDAVIPVQLTKDICQQHDKLIMFNGVIEHNPLAEKEHAIDVCYKWAGINPEGRDKKIIVNILDSEKEWAYNDLMKRGYDLKKPFVSISPNASMAKNRSWPMEYMQELRQRLSKDFNVVYIHRGEGWSLRESMRIISVMDCVVTVDTGLLHVAGALDKNIVALFGSFNPDLRCKYFNNCHVICHNNKTCKSFCFNHRDYCNKTGKERTYPPCSLIIKPEEVERKVREIV